MADLLLAANGYDERESAPSLHRYWQVADEQVYEYRMSDTFVPFRRNVHYSQCREVKIADLLDQLSFTRGKRNWGYAFRYGHFQIEREDFLTISRAMLDDKGNS